MISSRWKADNEELCGIKSYVRLIRFPLPARFEPGLLIYEGPVVQSILSLTSLLRGQLIKCFTTLLPNTLIFFVEKIQEAFALQKFHTFFQQKILAYLRYSQTCLCGHLHYGITCFKQPPFLGPLTQNTEQMNLY